MPVDILAPLETGSLNKLSAVSNDDARTALAADTITNPGGACGTFNFGVPNYQIYRSYAVYDTTPYSGVHINSVTLKAEVNSIFGFYFNDTHWNRVEAAGMNWPVQLADYHTLFHAAVLNSFSLSMLDPLTIFTWASPIIGVNEIVRGGFTKFAFRDAQDIGGGDNRDWGTIICTDLIIDWDPRIIVPSGNIPNKLVDKRLI
jgi:hypothetical protein